MVDQSARFAWYELLTTDVAAASAFYREVVGWGAKDASTADLAYTVLAAGEAPVGGLMDLPEEGRRLGATPRWLGYVAVDDIDAMATQIRRRGGAVLLPPTDSNIGQVSVVADPQKATFALVDGLTYGQGQPGGLDELGRVGWHELLAQDRNKIFDFYGELFGWQKASGETDPADRINCFRRAGRRSVACSPSFRACRSRVGSIISTSTTSARRATASTLAEAGCSRVRSNCPMVAGSRDASIPRAPCSRCRAPAVRETPSAPPNRKSPGPRSGVALLRRAGWCCRSRSGRSGCCRCLPRRRGDIRIEAISLVWHIMPYSPRCRTT